MITSAVSSLKGISWSYRLLLEWSTILFVSLLIGIYGSEGFLDTPFEDTRQYYEAAVHYPEPYKLPVTYLVADPAPIPYRVYTPIGAILALPLRLVPLDVAKVLIRVATVIALYLLVERSMKKFIVVLLSPFSVFLFHFGNIDALVALGLLLPASGGLLLLLGKPQVALLGALAMLRRDGWRHAVLPILLFVITTLVWPVWIDRARLVSDPWWDMSLFPWTLPLAGWFLWRSWSDRDPILGGLATILASPYLNNITIAVGIVLLLNRFPRAGCVVVALLWLVFFMRV